MDSKGIRLFQLNHQIKETLSGAFTSDIWVVAEISELRYNQNGHCYLELVEKDEAGDQIVAKARATIWSYTFRMLKPYFETTTGQAFTAGIKILVSVSIEFQEVYGYSLNIKDIDPSYTLGDIARRRKEILNQLDEEGVLKMNQELDFPEIPKCIAVISSPTAAGYEDFMNQLNNNAFGYQFHCKLFPAIMQGNRAEESIVQALDKINEYEHLFDVVVVIRGGGSQADLSCFDSYWLAFNIAQFPLPVLSGIGHERDESIVDMVANSCVKTPTAAAEYLLDCFDECRAYQKNLQECFVAGVQEVVSHASERLLDCSRIFSPLVRQILERKTNQLLLVNEKLTYVCKSLTEHQHYVIQNAQTKMHYALPKSIVGKKTSLDHLENKVSARIQHLLNNQKHKLSLFEQSVNYLTPETILKKGYTLTLKNGKIVKDIRLLSEQDVIESLFANGSVKSKVKSIIPKKTDTNG